MRAEVEKNSAAAYISVLLPACVFINVSSTGMKIFTVKGKYVSYITVFNYLLCTDNG
jgi:hypothetical protein